MWRVVTSTIAALALFASTAAAQALCTTDANRVVSEVYRHMLEREVWEEHGRAPGWQLRMRAQS